ncbi:zinc finger and SCAN domain-containing protein 29-like [Ostrea edulis]|uniref:zinc finger and SCAN domain-containing protein 29-like n=1 Tax=Ostrea edulis TaxID=37623 RepID=UPI0024AF6BFC|nr:zinc finger and SCAN domain-containing protein 29-like [Ostrea edulis]
MADRGAVWTDDETRLLIKFWGQKEVQESLGGTYRNSEIYDQIADKMAENGYDRNAKQCRCKVKQLKKDYRREREFGSPSKRRAFRFYDEMEGILGNLEAPGLAPESTSDTEISNQTEENVTVGDQKIKSSEAGLVPSWDSAIESIKVEMPPSKFEISAPGNSSRTETNNNTAVSQEKFRKRRSITSLADRLRTAKRCRSSFIKTRDGERDTKSLLERTLVSQTPEFQASVLLEMERMKIEKEIELERMRLEYKQKQWKDILQLLTQKYSPRNVCSTQSTSGINSSSQNLNNCDGVENSRSSESNAS